MKKINTLLAILSFAFALPANSQSVVLTTEDLTIEQGEVFTVEVKVSNFNAIATVQFPVYWNSAVLKFKSVDDFGLPDLSTSLNFNTDSILTGKLRFNWIDPSAELEGVTLASESVLFSIEFEAIGGPGQSTALEIKNDPIFPPMPVELVNANSVEQEVEIENSVITIFGVNATNETSTDDFVLFQNSPNPFGAYTNISFQLNQSSDAQLSIYDHAGKLVFEETKPYSGGLHTVKIARDLFQSAGSYFYTLKTENATATRQLVVR